MGSEVIWVALSVALAGWWISAALRRVADAIDDQADAQRETCDAVDGIALAMQGFVDKITTSGVGFDTEGEA